MHTFSSTIGNSPVMEIIQVDPLVYGYMLDDDNFLLPVLETDAYNLMIF